MTIRDHRLTGAAKRWARAQLQTPRRRTERATKAITRRVKRSTDTKTPDTEHEVTTCPDCGQRRRPIHWCNPKGEEE